jgi:hypothetical protein
MLRRECLRFRGHGQPLARPGAVGAGCRKRVVGRGCRPAVVGDRRIKESPISARDWLGSKRSIGPKPSCRGASRNIWPGNPPRWPWRFGMTGGVARIFRGKNIFSRADGEDDRSEIQKDTVATKSPTSFPPIFLPKNILALLPPSSSPQSFWPIPNPSTATCKTVSRSLTQFAASWTTRE